MALSARRRGHKLEHGTRVRYRHLADIPESVVNAFARVKANAISQRKEMPLMTEASTAWGGIPEC